MAKTKTEWLRPIFKEWLKASPSFLKEMDKQLRLDYIAKTNRIFDINYFHVRCYEPTLDKFIKNFEELKATIIVGELMYGSYTYPDAECSIMWRDKSGLKYIKPFDDISNLNVEFKWLKLKIPQHNVKQFDWKKELELNYAFPIEYGSFSGSLDYVFNVDFENDLDKSNFRKIFEKAVQEWQLIKIENHYPIHFYKFNENSILSYEIYINSGLGSLQSIKFLLTKLKNEKVKNMEILNV